MAWLHRITIAALALVLGTASALAHVFISIDKSTQRMAVSVNGAPRYQFAVSTGRPGYGTPSGTFHPQRMERTWFSREYYNSPMPHAIFFHGGFAIHGSYEINRLGGPASHGCVRLHPANAAALFALVKGEGMGATTIVVSAGTRTPASRFYEPLNERDDAQRYFWYQRPDRSF
jgi:lipoprotein-anchoring transpeptidase ErfK/SrfK